MTGTTISRAAKAANVNVETIRYYERRGLIEQPAKPLDGSAREYSAEAIERIRFVRQAQEIGFSLREIAELLSLRADPDANCAEVRSRAIEKREDVLEKIDRLSRIRHALDVLIARCPGAGDVSACTILDAMNGSLGNLQIADLAINDGEGNLVMKTTLLTIKGMHCDGCARTIEALLSGVSGVRKAEALFDERRVCVLHDPAKALETALVIAVAKGGFAATVERS